MQEQDIRFPRGDPDRHFSVEILIRDGEGTIIQHQAETMGRWILWQPVIWEVYDNRLLPLASRDYQFSYDLPKEATDWMLDVLIRYHILTDGQHEMLRESYGLTGNDPYVFTIYERKFPLK